MAGCAEYGEGAVDMWERLQPLPRKVGDPGQCSGTVMKPIFWMPAVRAADMISASFW